jgi:adenine phosphoribosyltransferase
MFECDGERAHLVNAILSAGKVAIESPGGSAYDFHLFPFGERGDYLGSALLQEIVTGLAELMKQHYPTVDLIVCPEPGGHTWGMMLAYKFGCSVAILRDGARDTEGPEGTRVDRQSAYLHSSLVFPELPPAARVVVVDDVISSGGTFSALLAGFTKRECELLGGLVILAKGEKGIAKVREAASVPVIALASLTGERVVRQAGVSESKAR